MSEQASRSELVQALRYCVNAISGGTVIHDQRGVVYEQQFGQAFLDHLNAVIDRATEGDSNG